jgi:hypothetical protein
MNHSRYMEKPRGFEDISSNLLRFDEDEFRDRVIDPHVYSVAQRFLG